MITHLLANITSQVYSFNSVYDLKASDSTGPKLDLAMTCLGSNTEWSSDPSIDAHCQWSSFTGAPIVEHTDGTGSNRMNEDGFSIADGSTMYSDEGHTTLLTEGSYFPAGFGYDSSGNPLTTQYPGPIAGDMPVAELPCLQGDGSGYVSISGLLTTDIISVAGGDVPTCTADGILSIGSGEKPRGITITRSGSTWAYYPCQNGHPTKKPDAYILEDIVGGNHGICMNFTQSPWGTYTPQEGDVNYFAKGYSEDKKVLPVPSSATLMWDYRYPDEALAGPLREFSVSGPTVQPDGTLASQPGIFDEGVFIGPQVEQFVSNPLCEGASAPSTFPTDWTGISNNGVSLSVVGAGTGYVDVRVSGTATGSAYPQIRFSPYVAVLLFRVIL